MKNGFQPSWCGLISQGVQAWMRQVPGLSRLAVATEVEKKYQTHGAPAVGTEPFALGRGDAFSGAAVAANRLFRWLDDVSKDGGLLPANMVPVILAALPEDLRIDLANRLFEQAGLALAPVYDPSGAHGISQALRNLAIEGGETSAALVALVDGIDPGELEAAHEHLERLQRLVAGTLGTVKNLLEGGQ